jgi:uncharacterized protein
MADHATARFPGRAAIDAYGNGGFRFAGMSHKGSILCLPSAIVSWPEADGLADPTMLTAEHLAAVFAGREGLGFLLLGTGKTQVFPSNVLRQAFRDAGIGLDAMSTGAAARTYNVLLAEGRSVAAALIAV